MRKTDPIIAKIKSVIKELEPYFVGHGGEIEFVSWHQQLGQVKVRLTGACQHCAMSGLTLHFGLLKKLKKHLPDIKEVVIK